MGTLNKLSATGVAKARIGRHGDGGGLILQVTSSEAKSWLFRYISPRTGKVREMGLGSAATISLKDARDMADVARKQVARRIDPLDERNARAAVVAVPTFGQCAADYIKSHASSWVPKHTTNLERALKRHVGFNGKLINEITVDDVRLMIFTLREVGKAALGTRLRALVESILDANDDHLTGKNPASWSGRLKKSMPPPSRVHRAVHHPAMDYQHVPDFMQRLRRNRTIAASALEFTILTSVRTSEALGARWDEFVLVSDSVGTWTIPAARMKARRQHTVPLSTRAIALLVELPKFVGSDHVFPGTREGKPINKDAMLELLHKLQPGVTVHGFRATFSSWASDMTEASHETIESALAHELPSAVARAYKRTSQMEKRRVLMEAWASFCSEKPQLRLVG